MTTANLKNKSKQELFDRLQRIDREIEVVTKRGGYNTIKIKSLNSARRKSKKYLYECFDCADATLKTTIDARGDERQILVRDCGQDICPYHDYFMGKDKPDAFEKIFRKYIDND